MLSHAEAKQIVDGLGVTPNESLFLRSVAWHETNYGAGWKQGQGAGSWNMGAITTRNPDSLAFKHVDSKFDDKTGTTQTYTTWFAGYDSPESGFRALEREVLKPNVKAALAGDDFYEAVHAMYDDSYFMGLHSHKTPDGNAQNVEDYYDAVSRAASTIGAQTSEQEPEPSTDGVDGTSTPSSGAGKVLVSLVILGGALWLGSKLLKSTTPTTAEV